MSTALHTYFAQAANSFKAPLPTPSNMPHPMPDYSTSGLTAAARSAYRDGRDPATDPEVIRQAIGHILANNGVSGALSMDIRELENQAKREAYTKVLPTWHKEAREAAKTVNDAATQLPAGSSLNAIMNGTDASLIALAAPAVQAASLLEAWERLINEPAGNAGNAAGPTNARPALFTPTLNQVLNNDSRHGVLDLVQAGWTLDPAKDWQEVQARYTALNNVEENIHQRIEQDTNARANGTSTATRGGYQWHAAVCRHAAAPAFNTLPSYN
ncbi:hypothetical protein [Galactobacter caseinivorans]|uniref:Uncharacterized protein n=1 Tax=Galactobacter caseinivorans TaxID=2676123 RepID=A0A496PH80_9MICC|nr:hypothetical protein [Galactobacter caseinivorans]RKW69838.1 hypothetical protein DWQ67_10160 [Galactobacter caseinivorans]